MDKIICSNIWKIFGNDEKRILDNLDPKDSADSIVSLDTCLIPKFVNLIIGGIA